MRVDVLIAGGGLAGLACAVALRGSGLTVALFEGSPALGGRARSWRDERTGDMVDIGPHVVTSHHRNFLDLLTLCGTRERIVWQPRPLVTLFDGVRSLDATLAPLPAPFALLPAFVKASHLTLRERLSNAAPTRAALRFDESDVPLLDAVDAATWLRGLGVAPAFVDWFWRSMCMTILNVPLERCSAAALLRCYAQLCGHSDYCFGFPAIGLGELFVPGCERLLGDAGTAVQVDAAVAALRFERERCVGATLGDGTDIEARFVVSALPPAETAALLPGHAALPRFEPSRYWCVYLWFERRVTSARFWTRVWSPDTANYDFYDLAAIRGLPPGRGSLIASNVIHSQRLPPLTDEEIVAVTLRELAQFAPDAAALRPVHARVHRIPFVVPCPEPGTETLRPAADAAPGGILLAGDWTRTALPASMESAVRSGRLAAEAVLRACGRQVALALPVPATTGLAGLVRAARQRRLRRDAKHARARA